MSLLLDSHSLLWYLTNDDRLPQPVKELLEDPAARVVISVASQWELMIKAMRGRLRLPDDPAHFLGDLPQESGFRVLAIQERHVFALSELPEIHADPFDRILVAQALVEGLDLVTGDETIRSYPVRTIW